MIAVVPSSSQIVVDHKAIPGFMDARPWLSGGAPVLLGEAGRRGTRFAHHRPAQKAIVNMEKDARVRATHGRHLGHPRAWRVEEGGCCWHTKLAVCGRYSCW